MGRFTTGPASPGAACGLPGDRARSPAPTVLGNLQRIAPVARRWQVRLASRPEACGACNRPNKILPVVFEIFSPAAQGSRVPTAGNPWAETAARVAGYAVRALQPPVAARPKYCA